MKMRYRSPLHCMICRYNACYEELPLCHECVAEFQSILNRKCINCGKSPASCTCGENEKHKFLFFYEGFQAQRLVYLVKTNADAELLDFLAEAAIKSNGINPKHYDGVAFVPRLPKNKRRYGYDQAEELAKSISRIYGIPVLNVLKRIGGKEQKLLSRSERIKNIKNRYELKYEPTEQPQYKKILLVDDVCTTGATIDACAKLLRGSVARSVTPLVLAKTNVLRK